MASNFVKNAIFDGNLIAAKKASSMDLRTTNRGK